MSAPVKKAAPDAVVAALNLAIDQAEIGASWANDRIEPLIQAMIGLASYSSDNATEANERLKLIGRIAIETRILVNTMAGCFEREALDLSEQRAKLEGGAA